jgi:putative flavoprotein involved in K+ transport
MFAVSFSPAWSPFGHAGETMTHTPGLESQTSQQNPVEPWFDVIVIGGGQAGLSVGYHLAKRGLRFLILDANLRVGDAWRKRWDSLKLFSPARFDGLDGMPFPLPGDAFPTHAEMADYLEAYAAHFELPVKNGVRVDSLTKHGGRYRVKAGALELEAEQVIVAMSGYQEPRIPELAKALAPHIQQLHSSEYRRPAQLREGAVLVVGAGNSGAEIGFELAKQQRRVWVSGPDTGKVPFRITGFLARWLLVRLMFRVVFHRLLTIRTPMGRKARPKMLHAATPLIRTQTQDLIAAGAQRCGRVTGARGGRPVLEDGTVLEVANVIWCSGYSAGFSWIDLPIFDDRGDPEHVAGVVPSQPGLYFVGLPFLYAMSSSMIHGVGRDAQRIVGTVAQRARALGTVRAA